MRARLCCLLLLMAGAVWADEAAVSTKDSSTTASSESSASTGRSVYWGALPGVLALVFDPMLPNWNIQEARLSPEYVYFELRMKSYYSGGGGEARMVMHKRAKELTRLENHKGYEVVEYNESLESSLWGARRVVQGVIRFL